MCEQADRRLISRPREDCYLSGELRLGGEIRTYSFSKGSSIIAKFLLYTTRAILRVSNTEACEPKKSASEA